MSRQRLYYVRKFLNKPRFESTGLILADVEVERWVAAGGPNKGKSMSNVQAELTLGDCSRSVSLSFSVYYSGTIRERKADARNVRYKAHLLRDEINKFVDALDIALDEIDPQ